MNHELKGGIQYFPVNWGDQCQAKCRKTGKQCCHGCNTLVPNTVASGNSQQDDWYEVKGRPVRLCHSHWLSWHKRSKRLLTLALIDGGHLMVSNRYGYGSVVIKQDRIDFSQEKPRATIAPAWGWIGWKGRVPDGLLDRYPRYWFDAVVAVTVTYECGVCGEFDAIHTTPVANTHCSFCGGKVVTKTVAGVTKRVQGQLQQVEMSAEDAMLAWKTLPTK